MAFKKLTIEEQLREERRRNMRLQLELGTQMEAVKAAARQVVVLDEMTEEEMESILTLYEEYVPGRENKYKKDEVFHWGGKLYITKKEHKSEYWYKPEEIASLYDTFFHKDEEVEVITDWIEGRWYQPGDKCIGKDGKIYESIYDGNNVWEPTSYLRAWKLVEDQGGGE